MSQPQGKKLKHTNSGSDPKEEDAISSDQEKTRTLSKLELSKMLEMAEGQWGDAAEENALEATSLMEPAVEELTPPPLSVVQFSEEQEVPTPFERGELSELVSEGATSPEEELDAVSQKPPRVEEVTKPAALIAADAEHNNQSPRTPKPSKNLLWVGILIGALVGGALFMLVYLLFLDSAIL